jgi:hypothetical protein
MCSQVFSDSSYSYVEGSGAMMNMGRSNPESGASGKKRAQEVSSFSEAEQTSKRAKIPQGIYILLYTEGGPYQRFSGCIRPKHVQYRMQGLPLKTGVTDVTKMENGEKRSQIMLITPRV